MFLWINLSFHSTETALVRVHNDINLSLDNRECVLLILLDLSAAFDTVNHDTLLKRLEFDFGICGSALKLIKSYVEGRSQSEVVNDIPSKQTPLTTSVPQGSVLGPILFTLYTKPLGSIV